MAEFYTELAEIADELLKPTDEEGFGQGAVTLTRVTPDIVDEDDPLGVVTDSTVTYLLKATVKSVEDKFINGTTIFATDSMVTASPVMTKTHEDGVAVENVDVTLEVQPGDVMAIDGDVVSIVREMRLPKAGTAVAWKFVVRG